MNMRATFFSAGKSGPGVLLLHMCNTTRKSWEPVARQLSEAGINALTLDNPGFGESGGPRFETGSPEVKQQIERKWPGEFDAAFAYLLAQPGVDRNRIAVGGGSCGVNNAVQLARRHLEVKTMVLLAGPTDLPGVNFIQSSSWMPIFTAAAADDEYDSGAPQLMQWLSEISGNPRNKFMGFANGRHGTEIFPVHPELPRAITAFYVDTLITSPVDPTARFAVKDSQVLEFWRLISDPKSAMKATEMFQAARAKDPNVFLFPESIVNLLGYQRLSQGANENAVELFKLNTMAYPASANAQDSLSDGYLGLGRKDLALAAEERCLELLPADKSGADFKAALKKQAEEKVAKLKAETSSGSTGSS
jgi:dienelactone hydrolase